MNSPIPTYWSSPTAIYRARWLTNTNVPTRHRHSAASGNYARYGSLSLPYISRIRRCVQSSSHSTVSGFG